MSRRACRIAGEGRVKRNVEWPSVQSIARSESCDAYSDWESKGAFSESAPKLDLLSGERRRERVITQEEENRYLAAAPKLLAEVATVLADTGMRPHECYRLRWENITWSNGRNGTLLVTHGKTAAARRVLPLSPRVRLVLETRWTKTN